MRIEKILFLILIVFFNCKNEAICSFNENNAGKEIYDLDEATCFITLKLNQKKSYSKHIRNALIAEKNYMENIGLICDNESEDETEKETIIYFGEIADYALNVKKVNLTKEELIKVYETEMEYLKFIGVTEE